MIGKVDYRRQALVNEYDYLVHRLMKMGKGEEWSKAKIMARISSIELQYFKLYRTRLA